MNRYPRETLFILSAFISLMLFGCTKKTDDRESLIPSTITATALTKQYGLPIVPHSQLIDQAIRSTRIPISLGDDHVGYNDILVSTINLAVKSAPDAVTRFYRSYTPHVISESTVRGKMKMIQLSSVKDIDQAISNKISPVILITIRPTHLTSAERTAYESEIQALKKLPTNDRIQQKRVHEILRMLQNPVFVTLEIRVVKP